MRHQKTKVGTIPRSIASALFAGLVLFAGCGDDSADDSPAGDDTAVQSQSDGSASDEGEPQTGTEVELPEALAAFPLPEDAVVPFPATELDASQDPRETVVLSAEVPRAAEEVGPELEQALVDAGFEVEESNVGDATSGNIDFVDPEGLPGRVTIDVDPTQTDTTQLNVNVYRSGVR